MKTVQYEIYEGPQTITVISPSSSPASAQRYISLAAEDLSTRSRTYTVKSPDELPPRLSRYIYESPFESHQPRSSQTETNKKYTFRSESPSRGRSEERSIEIVTRSQSPARAASPHPRGILRNAASDSEKNHEDKHEKKTEKKQGKQQNDKHEKETFKSSTSTTVATVGATTALVKSSTRSRARSPSSSSEISDSASSTASTTSRSSKSSIRSDFSSYARTSSRTGTFYLAYGPHISPAQLKKHIHHKPSSTRPVALVRLQNYTWYINSRGVANISSCPAPEKTPAETDADIVWGLLYNLDQDSESELDDVFSWASHETGGSNKTKSELKERPWLQGENKTNKTFPMVEAVEWLIDPLHFGLEDTWNGDRIRAMTYIDDNNVRPGRIRNEYITQMSEALPAAIGYGIPRGWIDNVMRMYGIKPRRKRTVLDIEVEEAEEQTSPKRKSEKKKIEIEETVTRRGRSTEKYR